MPRVTVPAFQNRKRENPLEKDLYRLRCDDATLGQTSTHKPQLRLSLSIVDGNEQPDGSDPLGRTLADFLLLEFSASSQKGSEFLERKLDEAFLAFGVEFDEEGSFDPDDFIGKEAVGLVGTTEDNWGFPQSSVKRYKV